MPSFPDLAALNDWLEQRCVALWNEIPHAALPGSVADVWAAEQAALMPLPPAFDGFVEHSKRVSPTCLISFEHEEDQETIRGIVHRRKATASLRLSPTAPLACGSTPTVWWSCWKHASGVTPPRVRSCASMCG